MKPTYHTPIPKHCKKSSVNGFTMVELLVVIVIIAALAAVAVMATSSIKIKANQAKSLGNLKQLAVLHQLYATENNGRIVPGKSKDADGKTKEWYCHLAGQIITDRSIDGPSSFFNYNPFKMKPELEFFQPPNAFPPKISAGYWNFGYGLNMQPGLPGDQLQNTEEGWGGNFRMDAITEPSRRLMIAEWPAWNLYANNLPQVKKYAATQNKTLRVVFFDGHSETLTPEQFIKAFALK